MSGEAAAARPAGLTLGLEERPPMAAAVALGLQHVLVSNVWLDPVFVAAAAGLALPLAANLVNAIFLAAGIVTLLQSTRLVRLPVVEGPSAAFDGLMIGFGKAGQLAMATTRPADRRRHHLRLGGERPAGAHPAPVLAGRHRLGDPARRHRAGRLHPGRVLRRRSDQQQLRLLAGAGHLHGDAGDRRRVELLRSGTVALLRLHLGTAGRRRGGRRARQAQLRRRRERGLAGHPAACSPTGRSSSTSA